jgi:broad specificity phosphatase PhoE
VTSDLSRASETAAALAGLTGGQVRSSAALRETHGGTWEGQLADDLRADPQYIAWLAGDDVPAGGSETRSQVGDRAAVAVRAAAQELDAGGVAVVASHGGTIRSVIGRMLFGGLANCCWSVLEESRTGWRLVEHNAGSLPQVVLGDDR